VQPVIRQLRADQWETYRDVRLASLRDAPEAFAASFEDAAAFDESDWRHGLSLPCWMAFVGDEPVGMVRAARIDEEQPHLISMWVAPSARGSSVAELLVESVLAWARAADKSGVGLRVMSSNTRAQSLYLRCGFAPSGRTERLADGRVEIEMVHRLTTSHGATA
jgi:GNAT superfamily N-acetyltransferase